jgi:hypothetical protein
VVFHDGPRRGGRLPRLRAPFRRGIRPGRPAGAGLPPTPKPHAASEPPPGDLALAPTVRFTRARLASSPDRGPAFSFDEVRLRSCLRQLALALVGPALGGALHRDIKPNNIRVTSTGRLVLLDFGLVGDIVGEKHEHETSGAKVVGTPAYMAPEQAPRRSRGTRRRSLCRGRRALRGTDGHPPVQGPVGLDPRPEAAARARGGELDRPGDSAGPRHPLCGAAPPRSQEAPHDRVTSARARRADRRPPPASGTRRTTSRSSGGPRRWRRSARRTASRSSANR